MSECWTGSVGTFLASLSASLSSWWQKSGYQSTPALNPRLTPRTREIYTSMQYGHVFFFSFCNHTGYTEYSHKSSTAPTMASFGICSPGSIIGQAKRRSRSAASLRPLCGVMSKTDGYSCTRGFLFLGNQFLHHFIHSFNDDCPLGFMDPIFKGLKVFVLALPERDLSHQNGCAHIHLGNDIVHHNTGLVNLAVQPSSMSTVNRILMSRKR